MQVEDRLARTGADVDEHAVVLEPRRRCGVGHEAEHAPGFFVPRPSDGFAIVAEADHPNLKVEYDIYHAQRTEGEIVATIRNQIAAIGHIQIADNPGRNEPGTGELNWPFIFAAIDAAGYDSRIGLEYKPSTERTEDSLGWMKEYAQ